MAEQFRILSIDGGGIRGVFPAAYLNYVQQNLGATPLYKFFDLMVGTSTGGIIALALALDVPVSEILELYTARGKQVFQASLRKLSLGFVTPKYRNEPLVAELKRTFGENTILGDSKCRVCIPAIDVANCKTVVFKTRHRKEYIHDYKLRAWHVAAATSAAPAYFPAFEIPEHSIYVDGGLWANNPTLVGIVEAVKLGFSVDRIKVLSLGTGLKLLDKRRFSIKRLGLFGWGTSLVELTFQAQSQGATNWTSYLGVNHKRINVDLPNASRFGLDRVAGVVDLESKAVQKAKETFGEVRAEFFNEPAETFVPIPFKEGE